MRSQQPALQQDGKRAAPAGLASEDGRASQLDGVAPAANGVARIRLKRLELHGFKTFATRTTLEFAPGITAIVGPNGSGKSNLADAVRWVLGEQSSKLLRGRRGEDVIFAGGHGRAPMGMAEVCLTLDNAAGLLPADYTEVALSRRLFRSGEMEYLINRQRVRLRDVVDLLSRAGIAQASHSVIGQGLVDLALSLRPEERRALFEDAAGLRRFQAKQAEAMAKLAETRANAARVADLIAELAPRVAHLQRQARRAQDEARLRAQWLATLQTWLAHQRWEIEHALAALATEQAQLDRGSEDGRRVSEQAAAALAAARQRLTTAKEGLARSEGERAAARDTLSEARRQLAVQEERHRAAVRAVQELQAEVERLTRRLEAAAARVPEAERDYAAAVAAAETARAAAITARQRLAERERERTGQDEELQQARAAAARAARRLTQLTTQLQEAQQQLTRATKQAAEAAGGRARAEEALRSLMQREQALEARGRELATQQTVAEEHRRQAAEALAAARQRAEELHTRLAQLDRQIETLEARLAVLREVAGAEQARSERPEDAASNGGRRLAELLQVPAGLEAAAAAALNTAGISPGWIVVGTRREAMAAAAGHATRGGPRTTFVCMEALARRASLRGPAPPCPAGAHELSRLLEGAEAAAQGLLAGVCVVPDLATGLALAEALSPGEAPLLVTAAGDVVDPAGLITTGAPPDEAGKLRRWRELREATAALEAARAEREPAAAAAAEAATAASRLAAEAREAEAACRALQQQALRGEGERHGLVQQRLRLEKEVAWWTEFAGRATSQQAELQQRIEALRLEREAAQQAHEVAAAAVAQVAAAASARESALAALREQAAAAQTEAALAEQRATQAAQQAQQAKESLQAARASLEAARQRLARLHEEAAALEAAVQQSRAVVAKRETALAALDRRAEKEHAQVAALEAEVERARGEHEQARAALARMDQEVARLAAARASLEERLRALREQAAREVGELPLSARSNEAPEVLQQRLDTLQARLRSLGPVNQVALQEHAEASERLQFLKAQLADLESAAAAIESAMAELEAELRESFSRTFEAVAAEFRVYFRRLFGGGEAQLALTDPRHLAETGVEIVAQLPGKRRQELSLLSGGERALVAAALVFALLKARPSPFCIMDEVDAALDEANVGRFCDVLEELSAQTQFVLITHNRATMERAAALYGVTLGDDGISRVVSLDLRDPPPDGRTTGRGVS